MLISSWVDINTTLQFSKSVFDFLFLDVIWQLPIYLDFILYIYIYVYIIFFFLYSMLSTQLISTGMGEDAQC